MRINCKPISPGLIDGEIFNAQTIEDLDSAIGKIVACHTLDFLFITKLAFSKKYKGVILKQASSTSHIAVLLREGKIPTVSTDIDFENGDKVQLNGVSGVVTVNE